MIMGISFGRGVFFHDRHVLACAEVKNGVIHLWAENITFRTIAKLWIRVLFSLPWHYHLVHLALLGYVAAAVLDSRFAVISPWWIFVYVAGFHFIFPRQQKQFHGAEHKVFSYTGKKSLEAIELIRRADIVNDGCSTNLVVCFFAVFLPVLPFVPLEWAVAAGGAGALAGLLGERFLRRYLPFLYKASAFCQRHFTTREPHRLHLETAIRSYLLFEHMRDKAKQVA
jgi:uncharacterized protein YqhQ